MNDIIKQAGKDYYPKTAGTKGLKNQLRQHRIGKYIDIVQHFLNQKYDADLTLKDLILHGIKHTCEEDCTCHAECKKVNKLLNGEL